MNIEMLKDIVCAYGPSGREDEVRRVIEGYVRPHCDEMYTDALGNLIAVRRGASGKRIMLAAHMDQIGFIVTDIDERGFLRVSAVGGVSPLISRGHQVRFQNGARGVVSCESKEFDPAHLTAAKLFIDVGASTREEAEAIARVGDMASIVPDFRVMGSKAACACLDDRVGCAVMAEAFIKAESPHDVYAVFTVQEEVGCRGAAVAAYAIEPDLGIAYDVTGCGDTPDCPHLALALGKGVAVKVMDRSVIVPTVVRDFLEDCAEKAGVPFQREVLPYGGTDTSSIQRSRAGVLAGCLSLACRYVHSPNEMIDLSDADAAVRLTTEALGRQTLPTV